MKTLTLTLAALLLLSTTQIFTQPGSLDSSFSNDGKKIKPKGTCYASIIQPDGKILLAGSYSVKLTASFMVARYNSNGNIDRSFGNNGSAIIKFGSYSEAYAITVQPDEKIIAAGYASGDFAVVRLNADGKPDSSFGINGKITTDFYGKRDYINFVSIQPDNKILVIGTAFDSGGEQSKIALARYNTDGSLDNIFGSGGKIGTRANASEFDNGSSLILQPNGKIVAIGYSYTNSDYDFVLIRYKANGNVDSSFGTKGFTFTDFKDFDIAKAAAVQRNGKIVVAGYSDFFNSVIDLARYTKNGLLDSSFGTNGKVVTSIGGFSDKVNSIAIQPDNKIVVSGSSYNGSDNDFVLIRYTTNGKLDKNFGTNGIVTIDFRGDDFSRSVNLQPDGKIVAAGSSGAYFALARYNGFNTLNNSNLQNIASLNLGDELTGAIEVYPNPLQSFLNVDFKATNKLQKTINIYSANGKLVLTKSSGENMRLNLKQLIPGVYFIKINNNSGRLLYGGKVVKE